MHKQHVLPAGLRGISVSGHLLATFTQSSAEVVLAPPTSCLAAALHHFSAVCLRESDAVEGVAPIDRQRGADCLHELRIIIIIVIIIVVITITVVMMLNS